MKNIDNWLTNHKTEVFVVFVLLFIFLFLYIPYRPGFLKVKSTPERLISMESKSDSNFAKLFKRMDRQDSILLDYSTTMQHVPKIFPVPNAKITSRYGPRDSTIHWGIDMASKKGTPIFATAAGKVIEAKFVKGYGNKTRIDSGNGIVVTYAHQDSIFVSLNQEVLQGQKIGTVGNTGNSFGSHAHIEISQDGKRRNPIIFYQ
jgi:murein DD-endopeptidase MepM/ murein hydrolase activator NlpD